MWLVNESNQLNKGMVSGLNPQLVYSSSDFSPKFTWIVVAPFSFSMKNIKPTVKYFAVHKVLD